MKSSIWSNKFTKSTFLISLPLPIVVIILALLFGVVLGMHDLVLSLAVIGAIVMAIMIFLQKDELAATVVIAVSIVVDLYLGLYFVSLVIALVLLLIFFLTRSPRYPWVTPPALWLWVLFLVLAIFPATQGITLFDRAQYYLRVFFSAFIIFWLGMVIARDIACVQRLFRALTVFGTLVAICTIIQVITGMLPFSTARYAAALLSVTNYELLGSGVNRAGAYLINPDPNGCFLAMMLLIALGLLIASPSFQEKGLYVVETLLISLALLFTYSIESMLGALAGIVILIAFIGCMRFRVSLLLLILGTVTVFIVCFPAQIALLLQHANTPSEQSLRFGAWQTAMRVIQAFPFTGIGLGNDVYRERADPYRVIAQYRILDHPHNSYLELAALGGIPVLVIFITLLSNSLWLALHNWAHADVRGRSLLGTGMAVVTVLSFVSLSDAGWTFTPVAVLGWLILGVITSPFVPPGSFGFYKRGER